MDLIYMDHSHVDIGVMTDYELDLAFGADENNFECLIPASSHCCQAGYYLYAEGTEYGGIIDTLEVRTEAEEVVYIGRTWHGILGSKIIMPLASSDSSTPYVTIKTEDSNGVSLVDKYLVISGDANRCIDFMLSRLGLSDLFTAPETDAGISISSFQFDRFVDGYKGIVKMLSSAGLKPKIRYQDGKVVISAVAQYNYATDEEFDSSMIEMKLKKKFNAVNHLVCLGSGELDQRTVLHLYADENGNISTTQTQFGMNEYTSVYDYSSVESEEELLKQGTEQLKELWEPDEMTIDMGDDSDYYDVGDKVGVTDNITGFSASSTIKKKIVKIKNDYTTISYKVGE